MVSNTPRWEWRAFAGDFGRIETQLRAGAAAPRKSAEAYIVSNRTDVNAKIRDQLLDIKVLERTNARGLELWIPRMQAGFPLTADSLRIAFAAWGLQPPTLDDTTWTLPHFLEAIVTPPSSLGLVDVTKVRHGTTIDDCLVEIADLTFDGTATRTVAVEATDPERVWRTVQALDLSGYENVNYVKALKRFLAARTG